MQTTQKDTHLYSIPEADRPYEKCFSMGPEALTDTELLAVILRTGTRGENALALAGRLIEMSQTHPGLLGFYHITIEDLMKVKGIGKVKAIQVVCIAELSKRFARARGSRSLSFTDPESIAAYYMEDMRHLDREELRLLILDGKNRLIKELVISKGTINMSPASPREIFREALRYSGVSIILLHNHPSGDATPSNADVEATRLLQKAGRLIGIELLDHIVIGDNCYTSITSCQKAI